MYVCICTYIHTQVFSIYIHPHIGVYIYIYIYTYTCGQRYADIYTGMLTGSLPRVHPLIEQSRCRRGKARAAPEPGGAAAQPGQGLFL